MALNDFYDLFKPHLCRLKYEMRAGQEIYIAHYNKVCSFKLVSDDKKIALECKSLEWTGTL